jgi:hypothetical protein
VPSPRAVPRRRRPRPGRSANPVLSGRSPPRAPVLRQLPSSARRLERVSRADCEPQLCADPVTQFRRRPPSATLEDTALTTVIGAIERKSSGPTTLPNGPRGPQGTVAEPTTGARLVGVAGCTGLPQDWSGENCLAGPRHAENVQVGFGAGRLGPCNSRCPAGAGPARRAASRTRLPGRARMQLRARRHLSGMHFGLHLPGVPLRAVTVLRGRSAPCLLPHALHLGWTRIGLRQQPERPRSCGAVDAGGAHLRLLRTSRDKVCLAAAQAA